VVDGEEAVVAAVEADRAEAGVAEEGVVARW
jgi:hypothetical protein